MRDRPVTGTYFMVKISRSQPLTNTLWVFFYFLTFAMIYFVSEHLLSLYIFGDQKYYIDFYYSVRGADLSEVPILQYSKTGSAEPFYGYLIWILSNSGLEKTPVIAAFNGLFGVLVAATIRRFNGNFALAVIIFTNYYFIVMITSAERLKFSYMVLCASILVGGKVGRVLFISSPLVHLQSAITIASVATGKLSSVIANTGRGPRGKVRIISGISVGFAFLFLAFQRFQERILGKFESYSGLGEGIWSTAEMVVFFLASLIVARKKWETVLFFIPLIAATAVLGGSRVNMIGFVMLLFIALKDRKAYHPILVVLYLYFAYKSVGFISNILKYGVGYV